MDLGPAPEGRPEVALSLGDTGWVGDRAGLKDGYPNTGITGRPGSP
jgi:hypothetical protein